MRKYKIIFIDDEEVIRESFLQLMDWENSRFEIVGIYKNGETAWEYLRENAVDIVVSDINMPFMDGIELLENIRRQQFQTRLIFLTGYEFFEYARKAVQLQAFDFLLKPVSREKLAEAIERAANDIECGERMRAEADKGIESLRNDFLNGVLYGKIRDIPARAQQAAIYCGEGSYLLVLVKMDIYEQHQTSAGEKESWHEQLKQAVQRQKETVEKHTDHRFEIYFTEGNDWDLHMVFLSVEAGLFTKAFVKEFLQGLFALQEEHQGYRLTFIAGRSRGTLAELQESYQKVRHAAEHRHILPGNGWQLTFEDDRIGDKDDGGNEIVLPTDTLLHHIRLGEEDEVRKDIARIYEPFRKDKYISLASAKMITTELAIVAFKGAVVGEDESVSYLYYLNHIQQLHTLEELEEDITQFAVKVAIGRKGVSNQKKGLADKALEYLKKNYRQEELSLNDVADALNVSVSYLAVLFKQETGQNFGNHLLTIRMEKAKELLRTTNLPVADIAEQVGYSSAQYFAVRFKKYTGVTPGTYREQA